MRNGNHIRICMSVSNSFSSYPTYEEWKLLTTIDFVYANKGSYPTYEEWKPILIYSTTEFWESSYPTYEEWKPLLNSF